MTILQTEKKEHMLFSLPVVHKPLTRSDLLHLLVLVMGYSESWGKIDGCGKGNYLQILERETFYLKNCEDY